MSVTAEEIAKVLGGHRSLGRRIRNMRELEDVVREGIPRRALDAFLAQFIAPDSEASMRLRDKIVPRAMYQRAERFNLQVSHAGRRARPTSSHCTMVMTTPT